jgi:mannose-1-phosphate guanylyltransferase/mannose-6-phosphate isomerase
MNEITPILLAGGIGKRLWPLSRKSFPKQFSKLLGEKSLFQESVIRLLSSESVTFKKPVTLTNEAYRFIIKQQFADIDVEPSSILIEPELKNTAPAILAASLFLLETDPEAILLVTPTDHLISSTKGFHEAVRLGLPSVEIGKIVTFGIPPTRNETGYGYIEIEEFNEQKPLSVKGFVEKPNKELVREMISSGKYLWNAGMFLFKAKDMIKAFESFAKNFVKPVRGAIEKGKNDLDFFRLEKKEWSKCEDKSIDYALIEKISNLETIPLSDGWSDLGGWNSVFEAMNKDSSGIAKTANAHVIDCKNTMLRSESVEQEIVGVGLKDIFVIAMPDAVLVAHKENSQNVQKAVEILKEKNIQQSESFQKSHRPWGWFETISIQKGNYQVKKITVSPGASLSLQRHKYRSEHWVVVDGIAKVTINKQTKNLSKGQSIFVPLGSIHRLENHGEFPMVLIEVQTGSYLGEDDIERFDDLYARN